MRSNASVIDFVTDVATKKIIAVKLKMEKKFKPKSLSSPPVANLVQTGSTGDGFKWLTKLGHTVTEPVASLVPITLSDKW